jgi:hypothetical protein
VAYDVDDWPWLAVGYSLIQDVAGLEIAERSFFDLMHRVSKINMSPPLGYDLNAGIPREDIKRFRMLDEMDTHLGVDGPPNAALQSVLPDSVRVTEESFKFLAALGDKRSKALGLNDLSSLEKLKFNLSSDNVDKLLETIGPVAKGIGSNMAVSHGKIVGMLKYMIPQYMTTKRVMAYAGRKRCSCRCSTSILSRLVPSHLPHEKGLKDQKKPSNLNKIQRAKWAAQNLRVTSVPDQLLNVTAMQEQLKWLNLFQQGAPVPFCEVAKKLNIKNWGDSPGSTLFEKWAVGAEGDGAGEGTSHGVSRRSSSGRTAAAGTS